MTMTPAFSSLAKDAPTGRTGRVRGERRMRGRRRRLVIAAALAAVVSGGYLFGGFVRFAQEVAELSTPARVERADGIVVLTGGAMRLDQAIGLLKEGRAERLLISGVNPETGIAALSRLTGTDRALFDCCVDLDYDALNTIGNAEMTGRWARSRGFDELILVTSDYHMPRTLMTFDRFAHVPVIRPYPVARADLWTGHSVPSGLGLKVLVTEYAKLLAARVRLLVSDEPPEASITADVRRAATPS
ncbi:MULTISPECIES: YdcF family protein [unclassified Aureimonas]|uniref:YdcF family protein n=1 Tax=unclassified Aureimonas TaxID=2615206 RepID=UPI0006FAE8FB|nr:MULTISPECIES: YdcF family protein [unclassified Aureimonas]KQT53968.1 hypothetical protein ASG62_12130 [Aureimonas sp. Leaf427]KQT71592.1 hypothetical protein ASG54_19030 [Aureimonas sp. Leaf460]